MSGVATKQIAAGLRRRGVDARTFVDADEPGGQGHRGVAVHGICVVGWRYPDGHREFTDRPPRLMEPDEHDPSGRWIWDDILSDRCQPAAAVSDQVHVVVGRVAELLAEAPISLARNALRTSEPGVRCVGTARRHPIDGTDSGVTIGSCVPKRLGRATRRTPRGWSITCAVRGQCSASTRQCLGQRSTASHQMFRWLRHYSIGCVTFICEPTFPPGRRSGIPRIRSAGLPSSPRWINTWAGTTQRLDGKHGADTIAALQRVQSEPRLEVTRSVGPDGRILVSPTAVAVSAAHHGWRPE